MIATISIVSCFTFMITGTVLLFVYGSIKHDQGMTYGGVGLLFVVLFLMFACCGASNGELSMLEGTYREERAECIQARKEAAEEKKRQIPNTPPIQPQTVTVSIQ